MNLINLKKKTKAKILDSIIKSGKGQIRRVFSYVDIQVAPYPGKVLNFNKKKFNLKNSDRLIYSKDHTGIILYE